MEKNILVTLKNGEYMWLEKAESIKYYAVPKDVLEVFEITDYVDLTRIWATNSD